jgi:hypothetical protein
MSPGVDYLINKAQGSMIKEHENRLIRLELKSFEGDFCQ